MSIKNLSKLLKLGFYVFLTIGVIGNAQKIKQRPEIYINNTIIEKVNAMDYTPTELIQANVMVGTKKGSGSGSIIKIDDKATYILTAAHVIYDEHTLLIRKGKLKRSGILSKSITVTVGEKKYKALTIKVDKELDVAIVKIYKKLKIIPVKIAKKQPKFGEAVWAISNPGGMKGIINKGIFSSIQEEYAVVSVAGFFGSSGGMVLNSKGELIGVISVVYKTLIDGYFPTITIYNGITKTKDLNKFLKGVL